MAQRISALAPGLLPWPIRGGGGGLFAFVFFFAVSVVVVPISPVLSASSAAGAFSVPDGKCRKGLAFSPAHNLQKVLKNYQTAVSAA